MTQNQERQPLYGSGNLTYTDISTTIINPAERSREATETAEVSDKRRVLLDKLKKDVENGKLSYDFIKSTLDSLDTIADKNDRMFVLGIIFSGLNQKGIKIDSIKGNEINFTPGNKPLVDKTTIIPGVDEVVNYQELFNSRIRSGKISIQDIHTALLYRSSVVDKFLTENKDSKEPLTTTEYVKRLLLKHNISIAQNKKPSDTDLKNFKFKSEEDYKLLRGHLDKNMFDNQADKEFILSYFDDIYYNQRKGINENAFEDYKLYSVKLGEISRKIFGSLNTLSDAKKIALGVRSSDEAAQLKTKLENDPIGLLTDSIDNGMFGSAAILAIIGGFLSFIFGGEFSSGAKIGAGVGVVASVPGATGILASEVSSHLGGENENSIYNKFSTLLESNAGTLDKNQVSNLWGELSKNDKFLKLDAENLNIFETKKGDLKEINKFFKSIGITLNLENRKYYEYIFAELLKNKKDNIGNYKPGETIKDYLERTAESQNAVGTNGTTNPGTAVAGGVAGTVPQAGAQAQSQNAPTNTTTLEKAGYTKLENGNYFKGDYKNGKVNNGMESNANQTVMNQRQDGKLIFIWEGSYINGKFDGVLKHQDGSGAVDIYKEGTKVDYTLEYIGGLMGLMGITLAPSATGPRGIVVSGMLGVGYSVADLANQDEDLLWDILKFSHVVDPRFEGGKKTFWDNAAAAVGLIPGLKHTQWLGKITTYISKLAPEKLQRLASVSGRVSEGIANRGESLLKGAGALSRTENKMFSQYSSQFIKSIKPGETKMIGGAEIRNTGNMIGKVRKSPEYEIKLADGTIKRGSIDDIIKDINITKVGEELKEAGKFNGILKEANIGKKITLDGHVVKLEKTGNEIDIVVLKSDGTTKLVGEELKNFTDNNFANIMKGFGVELNKPIPNKTLEEAKGILTTIKEHVKNSKYSPANKNEITKVISWLYSEALTPGRTALELIDIFKNTKGFFKSSGELLKLVMLGDRTAELSKWSSYKGLAIKGTLATGGILWEDELSASDFIEFLGYTMGGYLLGGYIDSKIKD
ncbi:MAG: hypothetical protein PHE25_01125 [Candidatus Gracilibacteria bacterium]|nr:hypothetical protein [Candidatus Gracilibacteria bacterium]